MVKRILNMLPVLIIASIILFFLLRVIPGDPARVILGRRAANIETIQALREKWGLNLPIYLQYFKWLRSAIMFDFGRSFLAGRTVIGLIMGRLPYSIYLGTVSIIISLFISIPLGVVAAVKRRSIFDYFSMVVAIIGASMPTFWLGLMLMLFLSAYLGLFPISGFHGTFFSLEGLKSVFLPALTLGSGFAAITARMTRSTMIEELGKEYVRTARAKGASFFSVIFSHAFPNVLIPVITIIGTQMATLFGGVILTETVFSWPGIGTLFYDSVLSRDYPIIQGIAFLTVLGVLMINLIVDLLYVLLDPRIRL
jgi:peptide/nickel transport system permease protein